MAKVRNAFSSSPLNSAFLPCFNDDMLLEDLDYSLIKPDPSELYEELNFSSWPTSSIYDDIQRMEADSDCGVFSESSDCSELSSKTEIRNGDCMWSGSSAMLSTSASSTASDVAASRAVPPAVINIKQEPTVVVANNSKLHQARRQQSQHQPHQQIAEIKLEPSDDYEQQLQQHSIPNSRTVQQPYAQQTQSMQHIPPGTSLLRRSNAQQQQQQQQHMKKVHKQQPQRMLVQDNAFSFGGMCLPIATPVDSASADKNNNALSYVRPDTPHSPDDEATEFKHNVDLHACVMGSNNIALTTDASSFIDNVSKELQDTSKSQIDIRLTGARPSLSEVIDVIVKDESTLMCDVTDAIIKDDGSMSRTSDFDSEDEESTGSSMIDEDLSFDPTSPVSSQASSGISSQHHSQSYYHSDHSYTRGIDELATIDTPSDSDEEIDVVSISDKKLPTNPSDKDRRALQNKVADKFSKAHVVKTPSGLRTIPPRRRYNLPYTPASSSPVKSVINSRYPSPASTPNQSTYTSKYVQQQQQMTLLSDGSSSSSSTPINVISDKSRKRVTAAAAADIINGVEYGKKHRGKKAKHHHSTVVTGIAVASGLGALKRHNTIDEMDTIEKRNLHNDMERQRRIGLKNLFEELKKQIPSIKDKERAPKVNILREAAKLCEALTREDQQLTEQKAMLKELMRKRQEQLARLRSMQRD